MMDGSWLHPASNYPGTHYIDTITDTQLEQAYYNAEGRSRYKLYNAEGDLVTVEVVRYTEHLQDALDWLRDSAQDPYIGFDLEWRPDTNAWDYNPVALMQLATCRRCIILQTALWNHLLPDELFAFLGNDRWVFCGFGSQSGDNEKMYMTFGCDLGIMRCYRDIQRLCSDLAYVQQGLAQLTTQITGCRYVKDARVTRSAWDDVELTPMQIKYAALDALLPVTLLRQLHGWAHVENNEAFCSSCGQTLGRPVALELRKCQQEKCCRKKGFSALKNLMQHMRSAQHPPMLVECEQCGRACLPGDYD